MPANNKLLPSGDTPERDQKTLGAVVIAHYGMAGIVALYGLMVAIGMVNTIIGAGWYQIMWTLLFAAIVLPSIATFSWLNYKSAKAILQRRDRHFSTFVAGMNLMVFPLGTVLGLYSWKVLSRQSVQDLYEEGVQALPPAKREKPAKVIPGLSQPEIAWHDPSLTIDDDEERLWKEIEAKTSGSKNTAGTADSGTEKSAPNSEPKSTSTPSGSVKLVAGDD